MWKKCSSQPGASTHRNVSSARAPASASARLKQCDIVGHFLLADVGDGPVADGALRRQELFEVQVLVELGEFDALARVAAHPTGFARLALARRQPREPPAVVREAEADLAQFAVADDVDARVGLFADGLDDPGLHASHDSGRYRGLGRT